MHARGRGPDLGCRLCRGKLGRPVARAFRMRSSARARWRCRSSSGDRNVGGERGEPHPVSISEPQLCSGMRAFFADDQPHALRPAFEDIAVEFGDPGAVADLTFRFDGRCPGGGRHCEDGPADLLGDRHADRARQPPASLGEPGDERMGAAAGVGTDQCPASAVALRQLGQGESGGDDVIGGAVAACVARPEQADHRLPAATASVIDEGHQRMVSEGLLPGRGGVLLLGMGQPQHPVQVHGRLTDPRRARALRPARPGSRARPSARPRRRCQYGGRPSGRRLPDRTRSARPAAWRHPRGSPRPAQPREPHPAGPCTVELTAKPNQSAPVGPRLMASEEAPPGP